MVVLRGLEVSYPRRIPGAHGKNGWRCIYDRVRDTQQDIYNGRLTLYISADTAPEYADPASPADAQRDILVCAAHRLRREAHDHDFDTA